MRKLNDFLQAKHPSGLVDKTYFNANATPLIGLYNTIDVCKTDGTIETFTDLTLINANTVAGDLVVVNNGSYDIGDNSIQLKDGVNWLFRGNPTISSDAVAGTFYDNNVIVYCRFSGDVNITNSNNGASRVVLTNSLSRIKGLEFRLKARVFIEAGATSTKTEYYNSLGTINSLSDISDTTHRLHLDTDFLPESNSLAEIKAYNTFGIPAALDDGIPYFVQTSINSATGIISILLINIATGAQHITVDTSSFILDIKVVF
jgi:hypothetical protein